MHTVPTRISVAMNVKVLCGTTFDFIGSFFLLYQFLFHLRSSMTVDLQGQSVDITKVYQEDRVQYYLATRRVIQKKEETMSCFALYIKSNR